LSAIRQVLTRYSAHDRSLFTGVPATGTPAAGKSHGVGGADDIRAVGWTAAKQDYYSAFGFASVVAGKWYHYFSSKWGLTEKGAETDHVNTCNFYRAHAAISGALVSYFCQCC
jgi:hypothetical protein